MTGERQHITEGLLALALLRSYEIHARDSVHPFPGQRRRGTLPPSDPKDPRCYARPCHVRLCLP
jgi:hypothetical protein